MKLPGIDELPRDTLVALARAYAQNWQTLDGLWFGTVEAEYGLDAAVRIDLKNWEKQSALEAERLKKVLGAEQGGLSSVLLVLSFMCWQLVSPLFVCEEETPRRIVFSYPRCPIQEGRNRRGKPEFPCKQMKLTLLSNVARVVEPRATLRCVCCPPDPHPDDVWCRWELSLPEQDAASRA